VTAVELREMCPSNASAGWWCCSNGIVLMPESCTLTGVLVILRQQMNGIDARIMPHQMGALVLLRTHARASPELSAVK
jgi:hypothetical protein